MNVKLKVLTAGVLFFTGQALSAQQTKSDSTTKENEITEVVLVGFGKKQAVKEATGAIGKVGKEIADMNSGSIDKALTGRVAGVQTGLSTGQPGGAAFIRVRGISSVNGRNNPIIIIDGVRVAQGDLTHNSTTGNILANLNESDIENITILKDAVSTSVFGADAGAGVVIITTKSGRKGKTRININAETGTSFRAIDGHRGLSTTQWKQYLSQAIANRRGISVEEATLRATAGTYGSTLAGIFNSTISTDWRNETERSGAPMQKVNASISGGSEKLTYYSSLGYFEQEGIVKNTSFKRVTSSNRINYKVSDKLSLATDIQMSYSATYTQSQGGTFANPVMGQYFLRPTEPVRNSYGSYNLGTSGRLSNGLYNVAAIQDLNFQKAQTSRFFTNLQADYKIAKGFNYKFVFAPEYINIEEDQYLSPLHGDAYNVGGRIYGYATRYFNFNIQNILSYDFKSGEKHNFNASLIQEAYKSDERQLNGYAETIGSTKLITLANAIIPRSAKGYKYTSSRGGYAATFHYDYDKLFLLDLSGRNDKVSTFWEDNKSGYFWSAGIGLDLARLDAIKSLKTISLLKLSTSYGTVGNLPTSSVSPFYTYVYNLNYNDEAAALPEGVDNKDLRWEKLRPLNIGFDLGLFNDKITLGMAYYNKRTDDLIFDIPLSLAQGGYTLIGGGPYASRWVNIGGMSNSGFEFTLGAKIFNNKDFSWSINANLSTLKNRMLKLAGGVDVINGNSILREGEVVNAFYLRKWAGVDPNTGAPTWYINGKDGEVTNDYNEAQRAIQGSRYATLFGGLDTQIQVKGFSIDAQFSYGFGNKIYDRWARYLYNDGQYTATYPGYEAQLDYWTPNNPKANNPAPIYQLGNKDANQASTRFLYKGDYVRLRSLKISYTFNKDFIRNAGLDNAQIYLLGNNLWTYAFDKNLKFDPDLQINGTANLTLPPMKTYSLGVNLNF